MRSRRSIPTRCLRPGACSCGRCPKPTAWTSAKARREPGLGRRTGRDSCCRTTRCRSQCRCRTGAGSGSLARPGGSVSSYPGTSTRWFARSSREPTPPGRGRRRSRTASRWWSASPAGRPSRSRTSAAGLRTRASQARTWSGARNGTRTPSSPGGPRTSPGPRATRRSRLGGATNGSTPRTRGSCRAIKNGSGSRPQRAIGSATPVRRWTAMRSDSTSSSTARSWESPSTRPLYIRRAFRATVSYRPVAELRRLAIANTEEIWSSS